MFWSRRKKLLKFSHLEMSRPYKCEAGVYWHYTVDFYNGPLSIFYILDLLCKLLKWSWKPQLWGYYCCQFFLNWLLLSLSLVKVPNEIWCCSIISEKKCNLLLVCYWKCQILYWLLIDTICRMWVCDSLEAGSTMLLWML